MGKNRKIANQDLTFNNQVSVHSRERFEERLGVSGIREQREIVKQAKKSGHKLSAYSEPFYSYLASKQMPGGHYSIRVFKDNVFVFDNQLDRLITVYAVDKEYVPTDKYLVPISNGRCIIALYEEDYKSALFVGYEGQIVEDIVDAVEFKSENKAKNYIMNNNTLKIYENRGYIIELIPME